MLKKINLYFDTIKRIPPKQNFYLIKEKILKKILPIRISSLKDIETKYVEVNKKEKFINISDKLKFSGVNKHIWDLGTKFSSPNHNYVKFVEKLLNSYLNSSDENNLSKFWKHEHEDIEFIYNVQRMYLFKEIMESLEYSDNQKLKVINSWIDNNPPEKGKAWMGFNCSIRLINWVKILSSIDNYDLIEDNYLEKIYCSIHQNLEFIKNNIEHHIPGNHVIFQYFAVWITLFLLDNNENKIYADLFEKEFNSEFLDSGLHFEKSTHYHLQVLQLGVYYSLIYFNNINIIPALLFDKIKKAYKILDGFSFQKNNLPLIGDNCYNFFHFNLQEDAQNLNALKEYLEISENHSDILEISNDYFISKKFNSHIIFDIGNIGLRQNPGHGHSDLLSIIFSHNGVPIFTDPGTKRYSNKHEDLELKKVGSHNTISVNGEDQSKLWGFFRWAFLPENLNYEYSNFEDKIHIKGSYIGFKNIGKVKHYREIELNNNELIINDDVKFNNLKVIEQTFVLSEYVDVKEEFDKLFLIAKEYKFELEINSSINYKTEIHNQKLYKSYDNPIDSKKIRIIYNCIEEKFKTQVILRRIDG